jgi:hypothetical protein
VVTAKIKEFQDCKELFPRFVRVPYRHLIYSTSGK